MDILSVTRRILEIAPSTEFLAPRLGFPSIVMPEREATAPYKLRTRPVIPMRVEGISVVGRLRTWPMSQSPSNVLELTTCIPLED